MDYTGPYVRLLQERLSQPKRVCFRTVPPTAAGALEVAGTAHATVNRVCIGWCSHDGGEEEVNHEILGVHADATAGGVCGRACQLLCHYLCAHELEQGVLWIRSVTSGVRGPLR